jgi:segregation and condensation protein B
MRQIGGDSAAPPLAAPPSETTGAKLARLEAILLVAREPLSSRKLAALADLADGTEARALVRELARRLRRRGSAMQPVEVAHGLQLLTRPQLADWLGKVQPPSSEMRLSAPALETLSVAAYRQPVTRAEIEAIRGVQCGEILRVLMERDFLRIVGRSEELGRPFLYGTTRKFLQVFGLRRLEQLPPVDQIRNAASCTADSPDPRASRDGSRQEVEV